MLTRCNLRDPLCTTLPLRAPDTGDEERRSRWRQFGTALNVELEVSLGPDPALHFSTCAFHEPSSIYPLMSGAYGGVARVLDHLQST